MNVQLIYHGSLKKFNNNESKKIFDVSEGTTVGELILKSGVPKNQVAFPALNGSRIKSDHILKNGDNVKLFQMVGGG